MMPDRLVKKMAQQSAGLAVWLIPAMCLAWGFWSASSGSSPVFLTLQQDSLVHVSPDQISVSDGSLPDPVRFRHPQPGDKPWVVWYWPGTDVDLRTLSRQLGWIKQQGFGGVEVVITGLGIEPDQRRGCFRDPVWMFTLRELSRMAGHLDLGLDWTLGPGIPADYCQGQQILTWGEAHVRGGRLLSADIPEPVPSSGHRFAGTLNREDVQHDRWISFPDSSHRLLGLWAARAQSDNRSIAYWNTTDQIQLNPDSTFL